MGKAIAIVKLSSLGDVVHALPVATALRQAFPAASLAWVVEAREAAILRGHPDLDDVLVADTRRWRRMAAARQMKAVAAEIAVFCRRVRDKRFDVALDIQGTLKSGLVTAATRARLRIGYARSRCRDHVNALFTNRRVMPPPTARHIVDQYVSLLEPLGVGQDAPRSFTLAANAAVEVEARMEQFLVAHAMGPPTPVVAFLPGSRHAGKQWPTAHFQTLAQRLTSEMGVRVMVIWGPGEYETAGEIAAIPGGRAILAPPTDVEELVVLLRKCRVVVGGDTGPLHVAAAVGTATVGLYGPTSAERNGPYGAWARSIRSADGLMPSITPESVFECVAEQLMNMPP